MKPKNKLTSPFSLSKKILTTALGCISCTLTACYEPILIPPNGQGAAHAESYEFDIVTLSEWAAQILPTTASFDLILSKNNYYLIEYFDPETNSIPNETNDAEQNLNCPDNLPIATEESASLMIHTLPKDWIDKAGAENFSFQSVKYSGDDNTIQCIRTASYTLPDKNEWECNNEDKSIINSIIYYYETHASTDPEPEDNNDPNETETKTDPVLFKYTCTYTNGGASNLNRIWSDPKLYNNRPVIRITNGDSFGLSTNISSYFNDHLVPLFLNALGLNFDILGNHNFDKTLDYLNQIVKRSSYAYISTNLMNVSKVLPQISPYAIYEIPAQTKGAAPLRVAIIGTIDHAAIEKVFPGKFGAIAANNYCAVVQAIEKAYNQNARAFFITAHVSTNGTGLPELYNALFSFKDEQYIDQCQSLLEIPPDRLPDEIRRPGFMTINKNQEIYKHILSEMRNEIFQGIIGVFGEGSATARLIPFYYHQNKTKYCTSNTSDRCCSLSGVGDMPLPLCKYTDSSIDFLSYFSSSNYITKHPFFINSDTCSIPFGKVFPCYSYTLEDPPDDHIVYFTQFDSQSKLSGRFKVTARILPSVLPQDSIYASPYRVHVTQYDLVPVIGSPDQKITFVDSSKDMYDVSLISPTPTACRQYLAHLSEDGSDEAQACKDFYSWLATQNSHVSEALPYSLYEACYHAHNTLAQSKDNINHQDFIDKLTAKWTCIFHLLDYVSCTDENTGDERFTDQPIFAFNKAHLTPSDPIYDRQQTTFRTNIITNGVFNYVSHAMKEHQMKFDTILLNTGAIRNLGTSDLLNTEGLITQAWLNMTSPFNNVVQIRSLTAADLAIAMENALARSGQGGYPATTGIVVSYVSNQDESNNNIEIYEIWATDPWGALTAPLFIRIDGSNAACHDQCIFGDYTLSTVSAPKAELKVRLREGVLYKIENTYTDTCNPLPDGNGCGTIEFKRLVLATKTSHSKPPFTYLAQSNAMGTMERELSLVTNDYITSTKDYFSEDTAPNAVPFPSADYPIKKCVSSYYSKNIYNEQNTIYDYIAKEQTSIRCSEMQTVSNTSTLDNMDATDVACMLNVNHFYPVGSSSAFSRWVFQASPYDKNYANRITSLNDLCRVEHLNNRKTP